MKDKRNIRYPVGTLVTMSDFNYPILIIAHEMWLESEGKRYNYMGVQYPVGFLPEGEFVFLDHDMVIDILNLGFLHPEHVAFSDMLDMEFKVGMYAEAKDIELAVEVQEEEFLEL